MSRNSSFRSRNFTISYYEPLIQGGNWLGEIHTSAENWNHRISAFGGFDSADFTLQADRSVLESWTVEGLGRGIVVYDENLSPVWEGFVNMITLSNSGLSVTYGPLTEVCNQVKAVYSLIETGQDPPEVGDRVSTATQQDAESQNKWGIWPQVLSLAGVTTSNADQLVSLYLKDHKDPKINSTFSFSQQEISLSISCVGYMYTLSQPFNSTQNFTLNLSTRLGQIISSQLNGWVSTDYSKIQSNTTQVKAYQNDDQLALEQIRGLVAMGDASDNRYTFGIYENRQAVYESESSTIDYFINLSDPNRGILDSGGGRVDPWRVRPGKWVFFEDFMTTLGSHGENLRQDPRCLFIESVTFDLRTPFAVQLEGGTNYRYDQRLARLGLRGMDV